MPLPKKKIPPSLPPLRPTGVALGGGGAVRIKKSIAKIIQLLISNFVCIILY